jgi:hypothetical protein
MQFDALRALGHLEIRESRDGFFEHVVALPRRVSMLPSRANAGFFPGGSIGLAYPLQAVATGTYSERELSALLAAAAKVGVSCHVTRQPKQCWLVPDRVCLQAAEELQIAQVCAAAEWDYSNIPFCSSLAPHMPMLLAFLSEVEWRPGQPPDTGDMRAFDPRLCRTVLLGHVADSLVACECPIGDGSRRMTYWLYDTKLDRSAPSPRQLARWVARLKAEDLAHALPTLATGELLCPIELRPPPLIERLVCSCSGLAPKVLTCMKPSNVDWSGIGLPVPSDTLPHWITGAHVYSGHILAYPQFAASPLRTDDEGKSRFGHLGVTLERISSMHLCELGEECQ